MAYFAYRDKRSSLVCLFREPAQEPSGSNGFHQKGLYYHSAYAERIALFLLYAGANEELLISPFHAGLKHHLHQEIALLKPESLSASFVLAHELEAKHTALLQSVPSRPSFGGPVLHSRGPHMGLRPASMTPLLPTLAKSTSNRISGAVAIAYLGHIIAAWELRADPSKIEAMSEWPKPSMVKQLRVFLGLTSYYHRFVRHYSHIAAPLIDLLKREAFQWSPDADAAFAALKQAMVSTPVLCLPNFSVMFIIMTDACAMQIGVVLLQAEQPVAYFIKKLGPRKMSASTYHKKLFAIVESVNKWDQYLLGREFLIRTDQRSLRELLHQVVQTPDQPYYLRKLMGFRFKIEYKARASNRVADALSQRDSMDDTFTTFFPFSQPVPVIMVDIRHGNTTKEDLY
ncbi:unnamed protein product [Cuscuta campestris]|uniref:Reverse transcriptase/retrotransposon-derived protein RNase H-like domain-containing protein n=1 Tax=Cuscuta campestris TaxID=132261 RepID=A0A484MXT5_9ASTE|nr:unnamed protein product [Cuscuta campestris]